MPLDALNNSEHLYFITASLINWLPLFTDRNYAMIVLEHLEWLRTKKKILLFAFVVMPSHLHLLIKPIDESIGKTLQSFGSFTAHKIIKELKKENQINILNILHEQRRDKRGHYSVWQEIHSENVFSEGFLIQKMEYIHSNPVSSKEELVKNRGDYLFSSAVYYDEGKSSIIKIDDINDYLAGL
jgi:putative transposase